MRILITGALGHIGSTLIRNPVLVSSACELIMVDNISTQRYPSAFNLPQGPCYRLLDRDLRDVVTPAVLSNVSAVIHLAAVADPGAAYRDPARVAAYNYDLTEHMAEQCMKASVPLMFASSTSVYPGGPELMKEDSACQNPKGPYAQGKLREEEHLIARGPDGLRFSILRLGTLFGTSPGMRFHTAVNKFCWQAATGQPIAVWRTAMDQIRPYLGVRDATHAIVHLLQSNWFQNEVVNLVSTNQTVGEVLEQVRLHRPLIETQIVDHPLMSSVDLEVSTAKAIELGCTFQSSVSDGVAETLRLLSPLRGPQPEESPRASIPYD